MDFRWSYFKDAKVYLLSMDETLRDETGVFDALGMRMGYPVLLPQGWTKP